VPTTWDELVPPPSSSPRAPREAASRTATCTPSGRNTFHFCSSCSRRRHDPERGQHEGRFNSAAGVAAVQIQKRCSTTDPASTGRTPTTTCCRPSPPGRCHVADGPYYMGLLKTGVPTSPATGRSRPPRTPRSRELPGRRASGSRSARSQGRSLAVHPVTCSGPSSRSACSHTREPPPATTAALESPELTKPDPYFGGQARSRSPGLRWRPRRTSLRGAWTEIDTFITDSLQSALLGQATRRRRSTTRRSQTDDALAK